MWDAEQYLRFETERARPFFDLLAAVNHDHARTVADLGCGPGGLTATLLARWPEAVIWGVDSSEEMIGHARRRAVIDRLRFEIGNVARWRAPVALDVIISNACFQWVPDHGALLDRLAAQLSAGGILAFQVPYNFDQPSHIAVRELVSDSEWSPRLQEIRQASVESPEWYRERLASLGFSVNAWQTVYDHLLDGDDPVVNWLSGTTLRPILAALDEQDERRFLADLSTCLGGAYPKGARGTVFPFRRLFVVANAPDQTNDSELRMASERE